jgi:hypothetical protein
VIFESGSRLERIEAYAFSSNSCAQSGLRSIVIPSSLVVLGESSFYGCWNLESVSFESGSRLERIEEGTFEFSGLTSIDIPPSLTFIDGSALSGVSLNSVSVSPDHKRFRLRDCFLEDYDGSTICRYFGVCSSVVVPSSVVVLGKASFLGCESLTSVIFESGSRLERIEESAFRLSKGLHSIEIPSSVVVLGESSFFRCRSLESMDF